MVKFSAGIMLVATESGSGLSKFFRDRNFVDLWYNVITKRR